jgi:hypothetical protein
MGGGSVHGKKGGMFPVMAGAAIGARAVGEKAGTQNPERRQGPGPGLRDPR